MTITIPPACRLAPLVIITALGLAWFSGCGAEDELRRPRHVFLITVDTLRADHLGFYGYPRATSGTLDQLAAESVVFDRAIAQWPKTGPSFASIFTGRYPQSTGLTHQAAIRVPEEYLTLPELMTDAGFVSVAVMSNGVLGRRLGWDRGFAEYRQTWTLAPEVSEEPAEYRKWINARRVNQLALPLLDRHREAERLFVWLHYSDPHAPYLLPEDVANPFLDDEHYTGEERVKLENPKATALGGQRELRYYVAQYDANVRFTDLNIREALDHARSLGLLRDALVVFTADHGESLGEHGYYFGHGRRPYNAGAHVPLFFWYPPGIEGGRRIDAPVELVDLYPTLLEWVAPAQPIPGLEGHSLLPVLRREAAAAPDELAFSQAGGGSPLTHYRSVQDARWKLIYHPPLSQHDRPELFELYRLDDDPGETRNLASAASPEYQRLHRELFAWMKGSDWIRRPRSEIEAHGQETLKALRALGYVE